MRPNTELVIGKLKEFVAETMVSKERYDNPPLDKDIVKILSNKLNDAIDIPKIPEFLEGMGFRFTIKILDGFIGKKLKPEYHEHYINILTAYANNGGLGAKEAIVVIVNKYIDIPFLNEEDEAEIFNQIGDFILSFFK